MQIHFFNKGSLKQISGGHLYNKYLINQLEAKGYQVIYYPTEQQIMEDEFLKKVAPQDVIVVDSLLILNNLDFLLAYKEQYAILGLIHLPQIFDPKNQIAELLPTIFEKERKIFDSIPIIVTSAFCKEKVVNAFGLNANTIYVLEPGVAGFKEKTHFREKPFRLINIAAFDVVKGQDKIVNALAQLKAYDWVMEFYGSAEHDPNYYQLVMQLVKDHGLENRIQIRGVIPHDEVNGVMMSADLLVQMSSFETYSMVIAEALASRLPFVSTRVGACAYFDHFGGGIYLPDFNEWSLESALENLFENEWTYRRLWENKKPVARRSWAKVAEEFMKIVQQQKLIVG